MILEGLAIDLPHIRHVLQVIQVVAEEEQLCILLAAEERNNRDAVFRLEPIAVRSVVYEHYSLEGPLEDA